MTQKTKRLAMLAVLMMGLMMLMVGPAMATVYLTYGGTGGYNDPVPEGLVPPTAIVSFDTIENYLGNNYLRIIIQNNSPLQNQSDPSLAFSIGELYFNSNPVYNATTFDFVTNENLRDHFGCAAPVLTTGGWSIRPPAKGAMNADGFGDFSWVLDFGNSPVSNITKVLFQISGSVPDENTFVKLPATDKKSDKPVVYGAVHFKGAGAQGASIYAGALKQGDDIVPPDWRVPEPATLALIASSSLLGLAFPLRRRKLLVK